MIDMFFQKATVEMHIVLLISFSEKMTTRNYFSNDYASFPE